MINGYLRATLSELIILNHVEKNNLKKLVEYGYNELDAAYVLAYKFTLEESIDFLDFNLASDLQIRQHIEKIINAKFIRDTDEILRHLLEIIKVEDAKKGENVDVSIAASIGLFVLHTSIKNQNYKNELKDLIIRVCEKYSGEVEKLITNEYLLIHGVAKFNARNQDFIDLFSHIQGQNSNFQHEQTLSHNFNQLYCLNRGHIQKTIAIVKNKFSIVYPK